MDLICIIQNLADLFWIPFETHSSNFFSEANSSRPLFGISSPQTIEQSSRGYHPKKIHKNRSGSYNHGEIVRWWGIFVKKEDFNATLSREDQHSTWFVEVNASHTRGRRLTVPLHVIDDVLLPWTKLICLQRVMKPWHHSWHHQSST